MLLGLPGKLIFPATTPNPRPVSLLSTFRCQLEYHLFQELILDLTPAQDGPLYLLPTFHTQLNLAYLSIYTIKTLKA